MNGSRRSRPFGPRRAEYVPAPSLADHAKKRWARPAPDVPCRISGSADASSAGPGGSGRLALPVPLRVAIARQESLPFCQGRIRQRFPSIPYRPHQVAQRGAIQRQVAEEVGMVTASAIVRPPRRHGQKLAHQRKVEVVKHGAVIEQPSPPAAEAVAGEFSRGGTGVAGIVGRAFRSSPKSADPPVDACGPNRRVAGVSP